MILNKLRQFFEFSLTRRGILYVFGEFNFFKSPQPSKALNTPPTAFMDEIIEFSKCTSFDALKRMDSSVKGLTTSQVTSQFNLYGFNELETGKNLKWYRHLGVCYVNPLNLLLTLLAGIALQTNDKRQAIVIVAMILLSILIRFIQESRSHKAIDHLMALVINEVHVRRQMSPAESSLAKSATDNIPTQSLVPGDIVILSGGDLIPADIRLLEVKDLYINQTTFTGESTPVEKRLDAIAPTDSLLDLNNICFMGSTVVSGTALALVIKTGKNTYLGQLSDRLHFSQLRTTNFELNINKVSWTIIRLMLVMTPIILLLNGFLKGDWIEAALFSLSIAVALTPEMLPVIITAALSKGAIMMAKKKVIVKRLEAIQNLGAMTVLCTDKTGTLTQNKIFLAHYSDAWGNQSDKVLEYTYLNSYYQTGLKNLLDVTVIEYVKSTAHDFLKIPCRKIDEIPFDFQRRCMSVVVAKPDGMHLLICKGAAEEILGICHNVYRGQNSTSLTEEIRQNLLQEIKNLNQDGLRVVAVAVKQFSPTDKDYTIKDEQDLILVGYTAFLDPPKESAAAAIDALQRHGIKVKILTGDNELVTRKICHEVGLRNEQVLLGGELDQLSESEFHEAVQKNTLFCKLTPFHKEKIVRCLQDQGEVVGFLGDGINDALALKISDIGISVDSASSIARESADLIMLEKNLMVLEAGVLEGRKIFMNIRKYLRMALSANFGNVITILVSSVFLPFLPMLPLQILIQNILYDLSQLSLSFDHVDQESIQTPISWDPKEIIRFMWYFSPLNSLADIATFLILWFVLNANSLSSQALFQSGWFIENLFSQLLIIYVLRTGKIPFLQSNASWPVVMTGLIVMGVSIVLSASSMGHYLGFVPLPEIFYPWLGAILLGYILMVQYFKYLYKNKYKWQ